MADDFDSARFERDQAARKALFIELLSATGKLRGLARERILFSEEPYRALSIIHGAFSRRHGDAYQDMTTREFDGVVARWRNLIRGAQLTQGE